MKQTSVNYISNSSLKETLFCENNHPISCKHNKVNKIVLRPIKQKLLTLQRLDFLKFSGWKGKIGD